MSTRRILYGEKRRRTWPWWLGSAVLAVVLGVIGYRMGPGLWARTTADDAIAWSGGTCLTLTQWEGLGWEEIGFASYAQAAQGNWDEPDSAQRCVPSTVRNGSVRLPPHAEAATYRVCDRAGSCNVARHTR